MAAPAQTNLDLTPSMARFRTAGMRAAAGIGGGIAVLMGLAILGPRIGPIVGGILGASIIGGEAGRTIALNAAMDSVIMAAAS